MRTSCARPRSPCACARGSAGTSSINASRSIYYMIKVLLAVFVGLFRARPTVARGDDAPVAAESSI